MYLSGDSWRRSLSRHPLILQVTVGFLCTPAQVGAEELELLQITRLINGHPENQSCGTLDAWT